MTRLFHPDDFCRACKGKGRITAQSEDQFFRLTTETCIDCGGTGWRAGAEIIALPNATDIAASNADHFAAERQRDADRLASYQADCLASWGGK